MSENTATAYGRAKALDQQDLGHYTTKSIIMPNPLIFKCEWESIEQKNDRKKKKSNEKEKNEKKNAKISTLLSFVGSTLCTYCTKSLIITMLKVLVLSLYNSVLYTRAREGCKCGAAASFCQITRKWTKVFRIFFYSIISRIYCQYWVYLGTFETIIVSLKMRIFAQYSKNVTLYKLHCFNTYT